MPLTAQRENNSCSLQNKHFCEDGDDDDELEEQVQTHNDDFDVAISLSIMAHLDGLKEAEVKDGDDEEGEEEHGHKVGDEDVVACVGLRYSQFRGAEYRYLWFLSFNCSVV